MTCPNANSHPDYQDCFRQAMAVATGQPGLHEFIATSLANVARRCEVNWLDQATAEALALGGLSEKGRGRLIEVRRQYVPQ